VARRNRADCFLRPRPKSEAWLTGTPVVVRSQAPGRFCAWRPDYHAPVRPGTAKDTFPLSGGPRQASPDLVSTGGPQTQFFGRLLARWAAFVGG